MYKVRFHLAAGENYRQWQVKNVHCGDVSYYVPEECTLQMFNCTLHNNARIAQDIFDGANKAVCAWIECETIVIYPKLDLSALVRQHTPISFNPRVNPFWTNRLNDNIDNNRYLEILTDNRQLLAMRYY